MVWSAAVRTGTRRRRTGSVRHDADYRPAAGRRRGRTRRPVPAVGGGPAHRGGGRPPPGLLAVGRRALAGRGQQRRAGQQPLPGRGLGQPALRLVPAAVAPGPAGLGAGRAGVDRPGPPRPGTDRRPGRDRRPVAERPTAGGPGRRPAGRAGAGRVHVVVRHLRRLGPRVRAGHVPVAADAGPDLGRGRGPHSRPGGGGGRGGAVGRPHDVLQLGPARGVLRGRVRRRRPRPAVADGGRDRRHRRRVCPDGAGVRAGDRAGQELHADGAGAVGVAAHGSQARPGVGPGQRRRPGRGAGRVHQLAVGRGVRRRAGAGGHGGDRPAGLVGPPAAAAAGRVRVRLGRARGRDGGVRRLPPRAPLRDAAVVLPQRAGAGRRVPGPDVRHCLPRPGRPGRGRRRPGRWGGVVPADVVGRDRPQDRHRRPGRHPRHRRRRRAT